MAVNTWAPSGFREGRSLQGLAPNYGVLTRFIAPTYATPIAFGDPVQITSNGVIQALPYNVAGQGIDGIFLGCQFFNPQNPIQPFQPYWPGVALASSTIVYARVAVDPHMTFYVQAGSSTPLTTTPLTQTAVGMNINLLAASPSGFTGQGMPSQPTFAGISQCSLDGGSVAATAGLPFRIVSIIGLNDGAGVAINPFYNPTLGNQWLEVSMNTQDFTNTTGV